jgi:D-ribulokinase
LYNALPPKKGLSAEIVTMDVTDSDRVGEVADQLVSRYGRIDILVNNAGIARSETPAEKVTDEHWLNVIDVNLNGTFWCCRAFGKHMLDAGSGSIVNIGSMSGFIVNKPQEQCYYNASKAAVHHLTKSLAAEWGRRGVRVNAVAPTYIATALNAFVKNTPQMYDAWIGGTPMARMGEVDEIASVVLFLASDDASLMTGSVVLVDGAIRVGRLAWIFNGIGMRQAFIGVDVGTSSARAGVFDEGGTLLATARHPITVWHETGNIVEQSSSEIWAACAASVRAAMGEAALPPSAIKGLGFDATCSLVVLDGAANPLTVSTSGDERRNVIVWMDHRAIAEARLVNDTHDDVLKYVGGSISPEMEIPKLLWLKRHLPSTYHSAGHFFDLADYLSFRATGSTTRSICTLACKWNFLAHEGRWSEGYFKRIGLGDLAPDSFSKIGNKIVAPGTPLGTGLIKSAAYDLGLPEGTPVSASLIDAHAGGVGTIGGRAKSGQSVDVCSRLAYIMGTSACIMATTSEPRFVPGVWGPYFSGMIPGFWLNEGGQSAAGAAIDHLMRSHPAHSEAFAAAHADGLEILEFLERRIISRSASPGEAALFARNIHVLPEFLGNRSPFADPDSRAIVAGMDLDADIGSMERLFVAGLCGLAYGLADVVEVFRSHGLECELMVISGGAGLSSLVRQIMADTTGLKYQPCRRRAVI